MQRDTAFRPEQAVARVLDELAGDISPEGISASASARTLSGVGLMAAVSGGADSVALLAILHRLAPRYGYRLSALTVDHRIRSAEESSGDAEYVAGLCAAFDPPVPCRIVRLEEGEVRRTADRRDRGTEEAARFLRYRHFALEAELAGADWILTGHTRNDQLETILMRFFQGAGTGALGGIAVRRGRYLRPLLTVDRESIEAWLRESGISWREDSTNSGEAYLRNRLRHRLIPVLDDVLPGWKSGVSTTAVRARLDDELCRETPRPVWTRSGDRLECPVADLVSLLPAQRLRFFQDGLVLLQVGRRFPFSLLHRLSRAVSRPMEGRQISGCGLVFAREGDRFFWGPDIVQNNKSGYLVYIARCGRYRLPCGELKVTGEAGTAYFESGLGPFALPLTVRSRRSGDTVLMADGKRKTLKKLMNDWSVPEAERDKIPVIEHSGTVRAVHGGALGYPDWYVKI